MLMNLTGSSSPGGGEGDRQGAPAETPIAPSRVRGTLIKTFLVVTAAAAGYEAVKQLVFPHITLWQSHAITVFVFGVAATVAVYAALRRQSEVLAPVRAELAARRRAEENLRQASEAFKRLVQASPVAIMAVDVNLNVQTWNAAAERLLGWSEAEILGKPLPTIPVSRREAFNAVFAKVREGETAEPRETQRLRKDGSLVDVITSTAVLRGASGEITGFMGILTDISERKRAEQQTRLLTTALEAAANGVAITNREGNILWVNPAFTRLTGYPGAEVIGQNPRILKSAAHDAAFYQKLWGTILAGEVWQGEIVNRRKDGALYTEEMTLTPVRDDHGGVSHFIAIKQDITERKRAEEELQRSAADARARADELAALMDAVPNMTLIAHDPECRRMTSNAMGIRLLRLPAGANVSASAPEAERPTTTRPIKNGRVLRPEELPVQLAASTGREIRNFEMGFEFNDGASRDFLCDAVPLFDAEGKVRGAVGSFMDITERKQAEEALRESDARFRRLTESNVIGVFVGDSSGCIVDANAEFLRMVAYTEADLRGGLIRWDRMTPAEYQPVNARIAQQLRTTGVSAPLETEYIGKDGRRLPALTGLAALDNSGSRAIAFVLDLTERKRAERDLQAAKEAAESANLAKSEFLANMSHEIRTPMNGIIGMTDLALDTPLSSEQRDYLTMVKDSADSLLSLINDILDFSKIESGKLSLDATDFNLHDLLANNLRLLSVRASQKGLEVAWSADDGVPERVRGDAGRIRQVLVNLVGNAIKFTEAGEVVVSVEVESRREEEIRLHFAIRDTGIGIPPEKQKVIFEAFSQVDASMTRKYGGTGLGLTISSRLVQMMDGKIWLESAVGRGSTFHFTARLELPKGKKAEAPPRQVVSLRGLRVLVVDDNATNRKILEAMLRHWLMAPELVASGPEGLMALERAACAGTPFSLVLLDAQMPKMDGFALAERIRENPHLAGATIMMLTSAGQRGDVARCRELGIAVYLIKPIRQSDLLEAILAALGKSPSAGGAATVITRHTLREERRRIQILLVEDNAINQQLAVRLLEKRGHQVTVAPNGVEALALWRQTRFDLALMDVQMPIMNGFETTAAIRQEEASTGMHLPIIAMTAHAMQGDRERCLAAGMDAYISKPIHGDELIELVEKTALGGPAPVPKTVRPVFNAVFDRGEALRRLQGDEDLLADMAEVFLEEYPAQLAGIRDAVEREDWEGIERAAHLLKGSVSNFAAQRAFAAALQLEKTAGGHDLRECRRLSAALEAELEALKPELLRREADKA